MGAVDVWCQQPTERFIQEPWLSSILRWTGRTDLRPAPIDVLVQAMDQADVEIGLLSAWCGPTGWLITNEQVKDAIDKRPGRFAGLASVDLNHPVAAVAEIRRCVAQGFVGVRVVPWLWDLPPNDRRYYPIYVACVEAGVPFCTQIGHTGPLRRSETGRLIPYLEDVLLDFPDLVVVGGHVGYPWMDEVFSLLHKFPNFYVDTSAYAVHRLPHELVELMRGHGRTRVLFGTNWPMLSPARCLERLRDLKLDDDARALFLSGNARRIFRLPASGGN